jgi:hypothetical protein
LHPGPSLFSPLAPAILPQNRSLLTRWAALACSGVTLCFAIAMTITDGIISPINYSVFTVSAASLLLAAIPEYRYSIDSLINQNK